MVSSISLSKFLRFQLLYVSLSLRLSVSLSLCYAIFVSRYWDWSFDVFTVIWLQHFWYALEIAYLIFSEPSWIGSDQIPSIYSVWGQSCAHWTLKYMNIILTVGYSQAHCVWAAFARKLWASCRWTLERLDLFDCAEDINLISDHILCKMISLDLSHRKSNSCGLFLYIYYLVFF